MTTPDIEYVHTDDMPEISGFGGEYETMCQAMLHAGVTWSMKHPGVELHIGGYEGVSGFVDFVNDMAKSLEAVLAAASQDSASGAMMQAVAERVFFIHHNGWDEYCRQLREYKAKADANAADPSFVDHIPDAVPDENPDINLVDALKNVFGEGNVFVINSPDDLDKILGAANTDPGNA